MGPHSFQCYPTSHVTSLDQPVIYHPLTIITQIVDLYETIVSPCRAFELRGTQHWGTLVTKINALLKSLTRCLLLQHQDIQVSRTRGI